MTLTHTPGASASRLKNVPALALLATLALTGLHIPSASALCQQGANCQQPRDEGHIPPPPPVSKKDIYCAYPVLLFAEVTDAHESGVTGPWAYMYFSSAPGAKADNYADYLGTGVTLTGSGVPPQYQYNYNNDAWASNFQGPNAITGESSRTQWEWNDPEIEAYGYETASWGGAGTPYRYGQRCLAVSVGALRPNMGDKTEYVYEDDESINPDDAVGGFQLSRRACETDVWGKGYATGWTNMYVARVWGDIADVRYKLWCYSCKNTTGCGTGVGLPRGPGY